MSTSIDELVFALGEEAHVHHSRYQAFAHQAEEMGHAQAAKFLRAIVAAEKARGGLYRKYLTDLSDRADTCDYFVCAKCGVAQTESAPTQCPLCHEPGAQFERIS